MKRIKLLIVFLPMILLSITSHAQELPFREMPPAAKTFNSGTLMGRITDGFGFRFYWATDGLTEEQLAFRPSEEARSIAETIDHIYTLANMFTNATIEQPIASLDISGLTFEEKRKNILAFIQTSSAIMKVSNDADFERYNLVFQNADGSGQRLPFWNGLNGPLEDALWHTGQVVTLRRMAGNPVKPRVDFMRGVVR